MVHQYGGSILASGNFFKKFWWISQVWNNTWIQYLEKCLFYLSSIRSFFLPSFTEWFNWIQLCLKYSTCFNLNFCRDLHLNGKDTTNEKLPPQNHYGDYTYAALPSNYPHPSMAPPPHPPLMYPVPMIPVHPGYGPWPAPQAGFSGFYNGPTYRGNVGRWGNEMVFWFSGFC